MKLTKILMIIAIVLVIALAAMMIATSIGGNDAADASTENGASETSAVQGTEYAQNNTESTAIPPDLDSNLTFSTLSPEATKAPETTPEVTPDVPDATEATTSETEAEEEDPLSPSIEDMTDLA